MKLSVNNPPDFSETFRTYADQTEADAAWVPKGAGYAIDLQERVIVGTLQGANANDNRIIFDLQSVLGTGINANDTKWTLRGKISVRSLSQGFLTAFLFGLSDTDASQSTLQNSIIGVWDMFNSIPRRYGGAGQPANSVLPIQASVFDRRDLEAVTGDTFWFELVRHSDKLATFEMFTDKDYTKSVNGPAGIEVPTGINALRFIVFYERQNANTGAYTYVVSDIEFWNNKVPSDIKGNETEYADDFAVDKGWITTNPTRLNIGGGQLNYNADGTGIFNDVITFDLGTNLPDAGWVCRFKFTIDTTIPGLDNTANDLYFVLSNNVNSPIGSQDCLGMRTFASALANIQRFTLAVVNNGLPGTVVISSFAFGFAINNPDTFFIEFSRLSTDRFRMRVYMDEGFTQLIAERTDIIPIGITQLRFLKAMVANFDGSGNSTYNGTIDDVKLWINNKATKINDFRSRNV